MSKEEYYLGIAEAVSIVSTCLKKHWGAVIIKDNVIVSTGYNGAPRGVMECTKRGYCHLTECRNKNKGLSRGTMYEECYSVHAEQNAIIFGELDRMKGSTLYLVGRERNSLEDNWEYVKNPVPCKLCRKMILNAGIEKVVVRLDKDNYRIIETKSWKIQPEENLVGGY